MKYFIVFIDIKIVGTADIVNIIRPFHTEVFPLYDEIIHSVMKYYEDKEMIVDTVGIKNILEVNYDEYIVNLSDEEKEKLNNDLFKNITKNIKSVSNEELMEIGIDINSILERIDDEVYFNESINVDLSIAKFIALQLYEFIKDDNFSPSNNYYTMFNLNPNEEMTEREYKKVKAKYKNDIIFIADYFMKYDCNEINQDELRNNFCKLSSIFTSLWK